MRDDLDLLHGNPEQIAVFLGVTPRTVKRWKAGITPLPEACRRLLRYRFEGDAAGLLGEDWEGFYFQQGEIFIPGWKYGFNPHQIKGMFFQVQQVRALENQLRDMETDILGREFIRGLIDHALKSQLPPDHVRFDIGREGDYADQ